MIRAATNRAFSFRRLWLLVRERIEEDAPAAGVVAAGAVALNLVGIAFGSPPFMNLGRPDGGWPFLIALGGLLFAGRAFYRMHQGRAATEWLLLPASPVEKYLAALLSYGLIYPFVASLASMLLSWALYGVGVLAGTGGGTVWIAFSRQPLSGWLAYLFVISLALAGSARFRKLAVIKTGAILFAWILLLSTLTMVGLLFATPQGRNSLYAWHLGAGSEWNFNLAFGPGSFDSAKTIALEWIGRVGTFVLALLANLYGWFLVSEKEATDEVQ